MAAQVFVAVVVIPFDCRILDGAIHPLDLTVGPRLVRFDQPVFDLIRRAYHVEAHFAECDAVAVSGLIGELQAIANIARTIGT